MVNGDQKARQIQVKLKNVKNKRKLDFINDILVMIGYEQVNMGNDELLFLYTKD